MNKVGDDFTVTHQVDEGGDDLTVTHQVDED